MLLTRCLYRIGVCISSQMLNTLLIKVRFRGQNNIVNQAHCSPTTDALQNQSQQLWQGINCKGLLPVYMVIDSTELHYKTLTLPRVMSLKAVRHYIQQSLGELLGLPPQQLCYDFFIHKMANHYLVELYAMDQALYQQYWQLGILLGQLQYIGPSDWVLRQYWQRYLPLQAAQGYVCRLIDQNYYWFKDSKGLSYLAPEAIYFESHMNHSDSTINWQTLELDQLPHRLQMFSSQTHSFSAALTASL